MHASEARWNHSLHAHAPNSLLQMWKAAGTFSTTTDLATSSNRHTHTTSLLPRKLSVMLILVLSVVSPFEIRVVAWEACWIPLTKKVRLLLSVSLLSNHPDSEQNNTSTSSTLKSSLPGCFRCSSFSGVRESHSTHLVPFPTTSTTVLLKFYNLVFKYLNSDKKRVFPQTSMFSTATTTTTTTTAVAATQKQRHNNNNSNNNNKKTK